jgi:hypothetical protein
MVDVSNEPCYLANNRVKSWSAVFQFLCKLGRDCKSDLGQHVLELILESVAFPVQFDHFLLQIAILLQHASVLLQEDRVFLLLPLEVLFALALLHCWMINYKGTAHSALYIESGVMARRSNSFGKIWVKLMILG